MEVLPKVVRDARFRAGRTLVQTGQAELAVDIFGSLLEDARHRFGDDSIETCPVYYEYGNALFRFVNRIKTSNNNTTDSETSTSTVDDSTVCTTTITTSKAAKTATKNTGGESNPTPNQRMKIQMREAAAAAAMRRAIRNQEEMTSLSTTTDNNNNNKPSNRNNNSCSNETLERESKNFQLLTRTKDSNENHTKYSQTIAKVQESNHNDDNENNENVTNTTKNTGSAIVGGASEVEDDMQLALEMMETAWAIIDEYQSEHLSSKSSPLLNVQYYDWVTEQVPRILTGIGDVLSSLSRHADSADAYSRALGYREAALNTEFATSDRRETVPYLRWRRLIVESNVLIAEELLLCPPDQDVITTESKVVLVRAVEDGVVDFARGYYNKARDELQEVVLLLGQFVASGMDVGTEKEDICYVATMVMGIGTKLAELDEQNVEPKPKGLEPTDVNPKKRKMSPKNTNNETK